MNFKLKKILEKLEIFASLKITKILAKTFLILWLVLIFITFFYFDDKKFLFAVIVPIFLFIFIIILIFGTKIKFNIKTLHKIIFEETLKKDTYSPKIINLIIAFPIFAVFLATIFILFNERLFVDLNLNNFYLYELNILTKIFVSYFFYCSVALFVYALGRRILKIFKFDFDTKLEQFVISVGVGFVPFMLAIFFLAVSGYLYPLAIWLLIIISFLFSVFEYKSIFRELNKATLKLEFKNSHSTFKSYTLIVLYILLAINFISVFKPGPVDHDSIAGYFNAPNLYVHYHQLVPFYNIAYINVSQNVEMLYAGILSILNINFLIHFSFLFLVLFLLAIYSFTKNYFSDQAAVLVLIFAYFTPWNFPLIDTLKLDLILAFYSLLFVYVLFNFLFKKKHFAGLIFLAILAGVLMGIKYNAVFIIIPAALVLIYYFYLKKMKWQWLLAFFIVSFLIFSPWAVKNLYYFNNPLYPFQNFGLSYELISPQKFTVNNSNVIGQKIGRGIAELMYGVDLEDNIFTQVFSAFVYNVKENGGYNGPIVLFFLPLLLVFWFKLKKNTPQFNHLIFICLAGTVLWIFKGIGRFWYMMPFYYLFYILIAVILVQLVDFFRKNKLITNLIIIFLIIIFFYTAVWSNNEIGLRMPYIVGAEEANTFLIKYSDPYEVSQFVNKNVIPGLGDKKILMTANSRAGYIFENDKYVIPDTTGSYFLALLDGNYTFEHAQKRLAEENIAYIIHEIEHFYANEWFYKSLGLGNYTQLLKEIRQNSEHLICTKNSRGQTTFCLYKL